MTNIHSTLRLALVALVLSVAPAAFGQASCPVGQSISPDTAGHCCWPGQAWSNSRQVCVGVPSCPPGTAAQGESCAVTCPAGQSVGPDTAGHCCWAGQAWSAARAACIGVPTACAPGFTPQGETCAVACPAGQSVGPDTAGHCCWSGQVWSTSRQTCVGVPQCPPGLVTQGEACLSVSVAAPAPPVAYAPVGVATPMAAVAQNAGYPVAAMPPPPGAGPVPPGVGTPAHFEPRGGRNQYEITIAGMGVTAHCSTPCDVNLPIGRYDLHVDGSGRFDTTLNVAGPIPFVARVQHQNRGLVNAGRGIAIVGVIAVFVGEIANIAITGNVFEFNEWGDLTLVGLGVELIGDIMMGVSGSNRVMTENLGRASRDERGPTRRAGLQFRGAGISAGATSRDGAAPFLVTGSFSF